MSTMEATKVTSSAPAPANRGETPRSAVRPLADFASLLASTRQSSKVLGDLITQRNAEAASARRQKQANRSLERARSEASHRSCRDEHEDAGSVEPTDALDSRSDRIEEQPAESSEQARHAEREPVTASHPESAWSGEQASLPAPRNESLATSTGIETSVSADSSAVTTPSAGPESATASSAATGAPVADPPAAGNAAGTSGLSPAVTTGAVQQVGAAATTNAGGSGTSGASIDTAATAAGRGGEGAGRAAGPSTEFQTLLDQLVRQRGSATRAQLQSGATAGKTDAKGINLSETGSVRELAHVVRSQINTRHSNMTLQLTPAELGRVRVNVEMHDQVVSIRFQAETAAGEEALRSRLNDLRGSLEQQGIQIDRIDVETRPTVQPDPAGESPQDSRQDAAQWDGSAAGGNGQQENTARTSGGMPSMPTSANLEDIAGESLRSGTPDTNRPAESGVDLVA